MGAGGWVRGVGSLSPSLPSELLHQHPSSCGGAVRDVTAGTACTCTTKVSMCQTWFEPSGGVCVYTMVEVPAW